MKLLVKRGSTSNAFRVFLMDKTSTTGAGKTGLTGNPTPSTGLKITVIADNQANASAKTYTNSSDFESITIGTFSNPTNDTKIRFGEVNSSNFPGLYELQLHNDLFNIASSKVLYVCIQQNDIAPAMVEIQLTVADLMTSIPSQVWDEAYSGHTTAGTFGKLMDILRKANLVTEGTVTSATASNTVMQFVSTTTDIANKADDHWRGQTLLFVSGSLVGQSTTVARFNTTTDTITLDSPLTAAPSVNDEFVMMPVHIHPIDEVGEAFLSARLKSVGQIGIVSATTVTSSADIAGVNSYVAGDTVTFLGSAPTNFTAGTIYYVISTNLSPTVFQLSASSGGSAITPGTASTYTVIPYEMRTVRAAMQYLRNKVEIVSSTLNVYTENDTAKAWTATVATSGSATPITSSDPA